MTTTVTLLSYLQNRIEDTFARYPHRFFTEHDIHSELARIATESLVKEEDSTQKLKSSQVGRLHHEYPTPFRCLMEHYNFRMVTEDEFKRGKKEKPSLRLKRGRIDLVVLNSDYISSNPLNIVSGKNYRDLLENLKEQKFPALDLAIEVVYHPILDEKPHTGIMKRRVESIVQDYQKLVALMKFRQSMTYPSAKKQPCYSSQTQDTESN